MSKLPRGPHWAQPGHVYEVLRRYRAQGDVALFTLEDIKREYAELGSKFLTDLYFLPRLMKKYAEPEPVKLKVGDKVAIMDVGSEGFCVEIGGRLAVAWDDRNWQWVDKLVPVVRVNPDDPPEGVEVQP